MYYVYILFSYKHKITYTGITVNITRRITEHNSGLSTFTKRHIPWELIYQETVPNRSETRKREKYFKSATGRRWLKNNVFNGPASTRRSPS